MSCKHAASGSDNNSGHPQKLPLLDQYGTFNTTGHTKWKPGYIHFSAEWVGWDELNEAMILSMVHFNCVLCFEYKRRPSSPNIYITFFFIKNLVTVSSTLKSQDGEGKKTQVHLKPLINWAIWLYIHNSCCLLGVSVISCGNKCTLGHIERRKNLFCD